VQSAQDARAHSHEPATLEWAKKITTKDIDLLSGTAKYNREAPADQVEKLKLLKGHVAQGQFITKIRKVFSKDEMTDDLIFVKAKSEWRGRCDRVFLDPADVSSINGEIWRAARCLGKTAAKLRSERAGRAQKPSPLTSTSSVESYSGERARVRGQRVAIWARFRKIERVRPLTPTLSPVYDSTELVEVRGEGRMRCFRMLAAPAPTLTLPRNYRRREPDIRRYYPRLHYSYRRWTARAQLSERPGNSLDDPIRLPHDLSGLSIKTPRVAGSTYDRSIQSRRIDVSPTGRSVAWLSMGGAISRNGNFVSATECTATRASSTARSFLTASAR